MGDRSTDSDLRCTFQRLIQTGDSSDMIGVVMNRLVGMALEVGRDANFPTFFYDFLLFGNLDLE